MPILEALVGSNSSDLYDAIFDVDVTGEFDLFEDSDNDFPALRSLTSRESLQPGPERKRLSSVQKSPRREFSTSRGSPRLQISRNLSPIAMPATSTEISLGEGLKFEPPQTDTLTAGVDVSIKRVEALLDGMRDLPVQRLKDEMKELQVRHPIYLYIPNCRSTVPFAPLGPSSPH
jgi:hypothetical protein